MREIKFRAWSSKLNKYVKPYNREIEGGSVGDNKWSLKTIGDDEHIIIEQYTGLKDKNGVEIYEGDIVAYQWTGEDSTPCQVMWDDKAVRFGFRDRGDTTIYGVNAPDILKRAEVIGNIHQNPELLA